MRWCVDAHHKGKKEIEALSVKMRTKLERILNLMEDYGPSYIREPYVKHLQDKLWEILLKDQTGISRVLYVSVSIRRILLLHAFIKKTQKTPKKALEIALQRMKEIEK